MFSMFVCTVVASCVVIGRIVAGYNVGYIVGYIVAGS